LSTRLSSAKAWAGCCTTAGPGWRRPSPGSGQQRAALRVAAHQAGSAAAKGRLGQHAGREIQPGQRPAAAPGQAGRNRCRNPDPARPLSAPLHAPLVHARQQRLPHLLLEAGVGVVVAGRRPEAAGELCLVHRLETLSAPWAPLSSVDGLGPRASSRRSTSSSPWAAHRVMRRRAVPTGTVGGRMAPAQTPHFRRRSASCRAATLSPHQQRLDGGRLPQAASRAPAPPTETGRQGEPGGHGPRRPRIPARCSGARRTPGRGHMGVVDIGGGQIDQVPTSSRLPPTKAPATPSALPKVPIWTCTLAGFTPRCQGAAPLGTQHAEAVGTSIISQLPLRCECGQPAA
jgi:hypothetical protein